MLAWLAFGTASTVIAEELTPMRVDVAPNVAAGPLYVAVASGYFRAEGLDVRLVSVDSAASARRAVASGAAIVAATPLDAPFFDDARTHDLKAFASVEGDQAGYPGNTLVIRKAAHDAGLRTWRDVGGKRIGISGGDAGADYAFARIAIKYGVDPNDVTVVEFGTAGAAMKALARGTIAAAIVPAIDAIHAKAGDPGVSLFRLGDEVPWTRAVLVVQGKVVQQQRSLVERFARAYQRGAAEYAETFLQRDDGGDVIQGPRYDDDRALVASRVRVPIDVLAYVAPWCDRLGRLDEADIERQLAFWQRRAKADRTTSSPSLVDSSLVVEHLPATAD